MAGPVYSDVIFFGTVVDTGIIFSPDLAPGYVAVIKWVSMIDTAPGWDHGCQFGWARGDNNQLVAVTPRYVASPPDGYQGNVGANPTDFFGEVRAVLLDTDVAYFTSIGGTYSCYASGYLLHPPS